MKHVLVSDLHLGMGRENGKLHPLEDFDSDREFGELLELALRHGRSLIINGDWLDFLQVEPFWNVGEFTNAAGVPLAYAASDALDKLDTILSRQKPHFEALRSFLADKGSLSIVQGNHDADLFFPAAACADAPPLQKRIREALGSPASEQLRFIESYLRIGSVHIEHGHQRCEHVNEFQNHPGIFHSERTHVLGGGPVRMELLWGSRLVMEFFNNLEHQYPFADNLKPTTRATWLGIKNRWVDGRTAASFLRFALGAGLPWRDVPEVLDASDDPIQAIQSLEDGSLKALFLERIATDPAFHLELASELDRAAKQRDEHWPRSERSAFGREEVVPLGDQQVAGVIRDAREFREAGALLLGSDVSAVIFGHTHFAIDGHAPDATIPGYFNSGTWIPSLDLKDPAIKRRLQEEDFPLELLKDRSIFRSRLSYIEIGEDGHVELKEMH